MRLAIARQNSPQRMPDSAQSLDTYLEADLAAIAAAQRYRRRRIVACADLDKPTRVNVDGRDCIHFCSNDYLGLSTHASVREAFATAANRYGVGSGASHLITGHGPEHHALEEELAAFMGTPRALVYSTGYMCNLGIASALVRRGDRVLEDRLNHASLIDAGLANGARFERYAHANAEALEKTLEPKAQRPTPQRSWIFTDGVFSMDGDVAPLKALHSVATKHDATLMIDDAHGFGVIGATGRGSLEYCGLTPREVPIYMATLGKAAGVFGAFVAGSETLIETLIQKSRTYIYTTAVPPAVAAATRAALKVIQTEPWRRERLHALIAQFRQGARELGLALFDSPTPIQPLILGDEAQALTASERLLERGLLVAAIRPPTVPQGTSRLRITFSAAHDMEDVERLLDALSHLPREH